MFAVTAIRGLSFASRIVSASSKAPPAMHTLATTPKQNWGKFIHSFPKQVCLFALLTRWTRTRWGSSAWTNPSDVRVFWFKITRSDYHDSFKAIELVNQTLKSTIPLLQNVICVHWRYGKTRKRAKTHLWRVYLTLLQSKKLADIPRPRFLWRSLISISLIVFHQAKNRPCLL